MTYLYRDAEWLRKRYWDDRLSMYEIADLCGTFESVIVKWMQKFNVPRRSRSAAIQNYFRREGGPGPLRIKDGYVLYYWPEHPLAQKIGHVVKEHRIVLWQKSGYSDVILNLLLKGVPVHHINGIKDDNRSENLELQLPGTHSHGLGESDMIEILRALGYHVTK